jgi:DNA-directed RNA polymerase specialized sigma24 family protein
MLTFSDISNPEDEDINLEESFDSSDSEGNIAYPTVSIEDQVSINDALESLDEPLRTVFFLRYKYLMQVESIDPNEPTLSNHFDKTPRTIRNWLKKADEILKKKQGENHE